MLARYPINSHALAPSKVEEDEIPVGSINLPGSEIPAISCRNVWKVFGRKIAGIPHDDASLRASSQTAALRDVTIDVRRGEVFVLMGLSGCGKSTLVRCLTHLGPASSGSILIDDRDIANLSADELRMLRRDRMGMVFQDFALLPHRTVVGNISFPLEVAGASDGNVRKRVHDLVELVGLTGRETYYPSELSGGQKQRVGIARSLANDPDLWFLDEPFSALDPIIRFELQSELLRLQKELRKTIVFVTHDFEEAIRLASRIAIMRDGKIIQIATPEQLVMSPADDYVRQFTKRVDRLSILTLRSLANPRVEGEGEALPENSLLKTVLPRIFSTEDPVPLVDQFGARCGSVSRDAVIAALSMKGDPDGATS